MAPNLGTSIMSRADPQAVGAAQGREVTFEVDEPGTLTATLSARLRKTGRTAKRRGKVRRLAHKEVTVTRAGDVSVTLRPSSALRVLLRRERELPSMLKVQVVDVARNRTARSIRVLFR